MSQGMVVLLRLGVKGGVNQSLIKVTLNSSLFCASHAAPPLLTTAGCLITHTMQRPRSSFICSSKQTLKVERLCGPHSWQEDQELTGESGLQWGAWATPQLPSLELFLNCLVLHNNVLRLSIKVTLLVHPKRAA